MYCLRHFIYYICKFPSNADGLSAGPRASSPLGRKTAPRSAVFSSSRPHLEYPYGGILLFLLLFNIKQCLSNSSLVAAATLFCYCFFLQPFGLGLIGLVNEKVIDCCGAAHIHNNVVYSTNNSGWHLVYIYETKRSFNNKQMEKRETEFILQYLRNITSKISTLFERIDALSERVEKLGRACGQAFHQTKSVVNRLAEATEETRMDLAEYGGTIEAASFF